MTIFSWMYLEAQIAFVHLSAVNLMSTAKVQDDFVAPWYSREDALMGKVVSQSWIWFECGGVEAPDGGANDAFTEKVGGLACWERATK